MNKVFFKPVSAYKFLIVEKNYRANMRRWQKNKTHTQAKIDSIIKGFFLSIGFSDN